MKLAARRPDDRQGMILLNVLIVVAIAAAAVTIMIVAQDIGVQRTIRLHDAAQAQAYSRAGELSAIVALRRDAVAAPGQDSLSEPWAAIGQRQIEVPGGSFALSISDEQSRFNVNTIAGGDAIPAFALSNIAQRAGVGRPSLNAIVLAVTTLGPLRDEGPLRTMGIDPADLDRLAPFITFLPTESSVNLNTASPVLLEILLQDAALAGRIVDLRSRGPITAEQAAAFGAGGLLGVRSNYFRVETDVRVGDIRRRTSAMIEREETADGWKVAVIGRRRMSAPR